MAGNPQANQLTAVRTSLFRQGSQQSTIDETLEVSDDTERESSALHQEPQLDVVVLGRRSEVGGSHEHPLLVGDQGLCVQ